MPVMILARHTSADGEMIRIVALDRYAAESNNPDEWNPFEALDDRFYPELERAGEGDVYTERANAYAGHIS